MQKGAGCEKTRLAPLLGSSTSNSLQVKVRFSYFLSAGSQWQLRDRHRWPICLRFTGARELLNTVGEPLCAWHWAVHRHRRNCNGIFTVIRTQVWTSFLLLLFILLSFFSFLLSVAPTTGFPTIKALLSSNSLHQINQTASQETDRVHPLLSSPIHSCCLVVFQKCV